MLSKYEICCDLMTGKRMFLSYGSATPVKSGLQMDVRQMEQSSSKLSIEIIFRLHLVVSATEHCDEFGKVVHNCVYIVIKSYM